MGQRNLHTPQPTSQHAQDSVEFGQLNTNQCRATIGNSFEPEPERLTLKLSGPEPRTNEHENKSQRGPWPGSAAAPG